MREANKMTERFLRLTEVMEKVGLRRSAIYDKISRREFPAPVKIGSASRWLASEVAAWMDEMVQDRGEEYREAG